MNWFDVDRKGLAKILERRGKGFIVLELLQNAWDQKVTKVDVTIEKPPASRDVIVVVEDDDPEGFSDLSHAFTLFAESEKKIDPGKRGRFNIGEKLVIAMCDEAMIETTTGRVRFDEKGRTKTGRVKRKRGSKFTGRLKMSKAELADCMALLEQVVPPASVATRVNGKLLPRRDVMREFEVVLPTEIADENGLLKRVRRKTEVRLIEPKPGEVGSIYELGIPVVETGDAYHYDVQQKVPVSLERDNVSPAYLKAIRTAVLNEIHEDIDADAASAGWVREALSDANCSAEAAKSAVHARFGGQAVAYDPSDKEANKLAVSNGYVVVHGGALSAAEWENVRKAGVLAPAGKVTPSPKPFSDDPRAPKLRVVDEARWTPAERNRVEQIKAIAQKLIGVRIRVVIANDFGWKYSAAYGARTMTINKARVGRAWFEGAITEKVLSLVIHELGHEYESDHLSHRFHDALCDLGARLAMSVQQDSGLLE